MAKTMTVRLRTDIDQWVTEQAAAAGLSEARLVELALLDLRASGWTAAKLQPRPA